MNTIEKIFLPLIGFLVLAIIGVRLWWNPFGSNMEKFFLKDHHWIILGLIAGIIGLSYFLAKWIKRRQTKYSQTSSVKENEKNQPSKQTDVDNKSIGQDAPVETNSMVNQTNKEISFLDIFDKIGDAICVVDSDFNVIEINQIWLKTFNFIKREVLGKKCYQVLYNRDELCQECPAMDAFKSGEIVSTEKSTISVDGKREHFEIKSIPVFNKEGNVVRVINYTRDITEHKEEVEKLHKANNQLETIIETIPDAVYFRGVQSSRLIIVNNAYKKLSELSLTETNERPISSNLAEHWEKTDRQVIENGELLRTKEKVTDGENELLLDTIKSPLYDEQGDVIGILGISRDITEYDKGNTQRLDKNRELASREKAKFSALISSIDENILLADNQDRVVDVNSQFASFLGRERQNILGESLFGLYSKNGTGDELREKLEVLRKQSNGSEEIKHSYSNGDVNLWMQPIYSDNKYEGVIIIAEPLLSTESEFPETEPLDENGDEEELANMAREFSAPIKIETEKFGIEIVDSSIEANIEDMVKSLVRRVQRDGKVLTMDIRLTSSHVKQDSDDELGLLHQTLMNIIGSVIKFTQEGKANIRTNVLSIENNEKLESETDSKKNQTYGVSDFL